MPLSSNSIAGSDFGSRYMYLKFLNELLETQTTKRSNNSLISQAYRDMFYSEYYYANNILDNYLQGTNQAYLFRNDEAAVYDGLYSIGTTTNSSRLNNLLQYYELDSIIPENSTVSYHV